MKTNLASSAKGDVADDSAKPDIEAEDLVPVYGVLRKKVEGWRSFLRTRRAVNRSERPWRLPKAELKRLKLLTPWDFYTRAAEIGALPGSLVLLVVWAARSQSQQSVSELWSGRIKDFLLQLIIPAFTSVNLWVASYVLSGETGTANADARRTIRAAFMYFSGAWLVYPTLVVNVCSLVAKLIEAELVDYRLVHGHAFVGEWVANLIRLLIMVVGLRASWLLARDFYTTIPERLFYESRGPDAYPGLGGGPLATYRILVVLSAPAVLLLSYGCGLAIGWATDLVVARVLGA